MYNHNYTFLKQIGKGGQGSVYLAFNHLMKEKICIKKIPKHLLFEKKAITLMKEVQHPNFPRTIDEFEDEQFYYQVMEYIDGKTLGTFCKQLSVSQSIKIGLQLLEMVDDLKNNGLTFNDLKPDNIILTKYKTIYIVDYGAVLRIGDVTSKRYGSVFFSSPEYIQKKTVSWKSDLYSVGKILEYICRKPNRHLLKWINKATHLQEENRFPTLINAYLALKKTSLMVRYIQIMLIIFSVACLSFNYKSQVHQLLVTTLDNAILFHSLNCYKWLDEDYKYQLSNLIMNKKERIYWDIQRNLCANSSHQQLLDRNVFLENKHLKGLSLEMENLHFYINYLIFEKDIDNLHNVYYFLKQYDSEMIKKTQIEIAFYLKQNEWLWIDFQNSKSEIRAYSLYRLFQLGYYNNGYLHQALNLLEKSNDQELIQKISLAIEQWGDDA